MAKVGGISNNLSMFKKIRNIELIKHNNNNVNFLDESTINKNYYNLFNRKRIVNLCHVYSIYKNIFDGNSFIPVVDLSVKYDTNKVNYGNIILPSQTLNKPKFDFCSDQNSFYTLVFLNPDGNLLSPNEEVLHWMISNVRKNDNGVFEFDEICEYLQPLPWQGSGLHRLVFVLLKQSKPLSTKSSDLNSNDITHRSFSLRNFLLTYKDQFKPVGISWFQSKWDLSVNKATVQKLNISEPVFKEYQLISKYSIKRQLINKLHSFKYYNYLALKQDK